MIDQHDPIYAVEYAFVDWVPNLEDAEPLLFEGETFTRSNGSAISRIYERLTKASRRRAGDWDGPGNVALEASYRQGVYDAFKALQEELDV